jgi:amino acid transporter
LVQGLLFIIQLVAIVYLILLTLLFTTLAILKRKNRRQLLIYISLTPVVLVALFFTWRIDVFTAETSDREKSVGAFEDNFGFKPPNSVKEIKHKNLGIYDTDAHWMAFTYDSVVLYKILIHDQPLDTTYLGSAKYD